MPTAIKRPVCRPTLRGLSHELARLRARVAALEDLHDLHAAVARHQGKPGVPWGKAKAVLGVD